MVDVVHHPSLPSLRADDHDEMSALAISPAGLALASPLRVTGKPPAPYRLVAAFPMPGRSRAGQPQATPSILSSRRLPARARRPSALAPGARLNLTSKMVKTGGFPLTEREITFTLERVLWQVTRDENRQINSNT